MLYSNGGVMFLIPYLCCLFFIAVPMYLCETAYGQLVEMKLQMRFGAIVQSWWAIIMCQTCVCFFTCIYYITLMAWSFSYFFDAFVSPLPWAKKDAASAKTLDALWNPEYFYDQTLKKSTGADDPGKMVGPLVGCMFLSYVFTYFSVWKGLKSTGKMVYVTCLLPYLILTIMLVRGLTLEGSGAGLSALFEAKPEFLGNIGVWKNAATQILFSSGVSYGPLMYYGTGR
jgi:SNF family Na+-dependent transporter